MPTLWQIMGRETMKLRLPEKLEFLVTEKIPYKGAYGGRVAAKSRGFSGGLIHTIVEDPKHPKRILCARELMTSIKDSTHRLLCDQIARFKYDHLFNITKTEISAINNSLILFKGLRANIIEIKGMEGLTHCWVDEAEKVSDESWDVLIPTIFRNEGAELWISWNTGTRNDPVWKRFVETSRPDAKIVKVNYYDNPWFPETSQREMEYDKKNDYKKYLRIWEGMPAEGGTFFSNFNKEMMVEEPFKIPPHIGSRNMYGGFDFGWGVNGRASYGQNYLDENNVPHRLFHWYPKNMTGQEQANDLYETISSFYFTEGVFPQQIAYDYEMDVVGPTDDKGWAPIDYFKERWKKGKKSPDAWVRAIKKRAPGWQVVTDYLGRDVTTQEPKMRYWAQYNPYWVHAMESAIQDPSDPLDMLKSNNDHACDDTRYSSMLMRALHTLKKLEERGEQGYDAQKSEVNRILTELANKKKIGVTGV